MNPLLRFVVSIGLALLAPLALAAPPPTLNYQGYLTTNPGGTPVNSTVGMTFKFYNAASAGALLHTESQPSVVVTNGNFNVLLGSPTPILLPFDVPYWLSVTITGDPEMSPRQPLASSPYAFRAAALDSTATIAGPQLTGSITTATIPVANVIGAVAGPAGPTGPQGIQGAPGPAGATGPAGPNDIAGNLTMVNSTNSAGNIMKGLVPFIHNFGISNTFVGLNAGNLVTTGFNNAANGTNALQNNSGGRSNTASGSGALRSNTTGDGNTASGANALSGNTIGSNNTVSGSGALATINPFGSDNNSAFGVAALANADGANNTAIGFQAGNALSSGSFNLYLANQGASAESNTTRIGSAQTRTFIAGIRSVTPAVNDALPVVIDSLGQLGTGVASGGTVTSVATGAGLSGGPITASGTIALATTNLLPTTACTANQIPKWNGSAWVCAADADTNSGGTVTSVTAGTGLTGGAITTTGTIGLTATNLLPACAATQIPKWSGSAWACATDDNSLPGGAAGQVLQGTAGAPVWTASPSLSGNLALVNSTPSAGNILKGNDRFIHNTGASNTFIGQLAGSLGVTGSGNTGGGSLALANIASGQLNTAFGTNTLLATTTGGSNTAIGEEALTNNTGNSNTALGLRAGENLTTGSFNTALGERAGNALTNGSFNLYLNNLGVSVESSTTRIGSTQTRAFIAGVRSVTTGVADALPVVIDSAGQLGTVASLPIAGNLTMLNSTASAGNILKGGLLFIHNFGLTNTFVGLDAGNLTMSGFANTGNGQRALFDNNTGSNNVAVGVNALATNSSGDSNVAIGMNAGISNTSGSNNIYLGNGSGGLTDESNTIRIGSSQTRTFIVAISGVTSGGGGTPVLVNGLGQLGVATSSRRFKEDIADMDAASSALMKLRPVTFHYKTDQDPARRTLQYGLIAEEVADVYPGLVVHAADGQIETVMYQHLPSMLLNEFQKQQRTLAVQAMDIQRQAAELSRQRTRVEFLERELQDIRTMLGR